MSLENILTTGIRNLKRGSILLGMSLSIAFSPMTVVSCGNNSDQTSLQECQTDDDCKGDRICNPYTKVCEFPEKEPEQEEELELCCGKIISVKYGNISALDLDNKIQTEWDLNFFSKDYHDAFRHISKSTDNNKIAFIKESQNHSRFDILITDNLGNHINQLEVDFHDLLSDYGNNFSVTSGDSGYALIDSGSKLVSHSKIYSSSTIDFPFKGLVTIDLENMQPIYLFEENDDFGSIHSFTVSSDDKIYFSCDHSETGDNSLYVMDSDGSNKNFLRNTLWELDWMYWVPSKESILADVSESHYLINLSLGTVEKISRSPPSSDGFIISPDGKKYVYDNDFLNDFDDDDDDIIEVSDFLEDNDFNCGESYCKSPETERAIWLP